MAPHAPVSDIAVTVRFAPGAAEPVLAAVESGRAGRPEDLDLRRRALALAASPGFDVLLSLSATRGVEPLDYQLATVRHVLKHLRGRALLCDEVGLGKTVEAGLIMMEYLLRGLVRRVLVLTPASLVAQWKEEMRTKFNLDFVTHDEERFRARPDAWSHFPRIIASLDTAKREPHRSQVVAAEYDLVIIDEAHHLKNRQTQAYRLAAELKKKYILLLTATPVQNDLEELFHLITLLAPGQLETVASFRRKYISPGDRLRPRNPEELRRLVREVMVRNRRSSVGVVMGRRHAEVVRVRLAPDEEAFYRRLTDFVRGHYGTAGAGAARGLDRFLLKTLQREVGSSVEAALQTLRKMAAGEAHPAPLREAMAALAREGEGVRGRAKAEALVALLRRIPEKVVVFTCFRATQQYLTARLRAEGFAVAELHGELRRAAKEEQVEFFARQAQVLVTTDAGSEGRNLQFCRVLVNFDLPWNPMRIEQRIGRIHRLGQTRDVFIYNLSAAGTVEAHILELLDAKINMFQLVIGELDLILGHLREQRDFEDLVMDVWASARSEEELRRGMEELGAQLLAARRHYETVKDVDDRLFGELRPDGD
ncbi:MAG: DEAD/DEAH box helicase [Desulfotomaculales bacterium]